MDRTVNPVAKTCEYCAKLITRKRKANGWQESLENFNKRKHCGVACYRAHEREARSGKIGSLEHFTGWR